MNIKPRTGIRNYAKGGEVGDPLGDPLDDPNKYVQGSSGGWSPGNVGGVPGGPSNPGGYTTNPGSYNRRRAGDSMTQAEFNAMTPDKLYPGTEYARQWKKLSPNG